MWKVLTCNSKKQNGETQKSFVHNLWVWTNLSCSKEKKITVNIQDKTCRFTKLTRQKFLYYIHEPTFLSNISRAREFLGKHAKNQSSSSAEQNHWDQVPNLHTNPLSGIYIELPPVWPARFHFISKKGRRLVLPDFSPLLNTILKLVYDNLKICISQSPETWENPTK